MNNLIPRPHLFDDFFRDINQGFLIKPLHGDPLPAPNQIRLDVKESEHAFTVMAEIPGVAKEDIHVSLDNNIVSLRAEIRQQDQQNKEQHFLRVERYFGEVARSFQLPAEIDVAESKAKYDNGVLTLTLPKKKSAQRNQKLRID